MGVGELEGFPRVLGVYWINSVVLPPYKKKI
jgi:hypothetical protein